MYIKILVYIIDNQQFKRKNKHSFFGSLIVCRSYFLISEGWGGDPKNGRPAGSISGRWSVPHQKTSVQNILSSPNTVPRQKHFSTKHA